MFEFSQDYLTYMKSPRWKAFCQRALGYHGRRCAACGSRLKLHVHHMTYERFKRETLSDVKILCDSCHRAVHSIHRSNRKVSLRLVTERYVLAKRMGK